MGAGESKGKYDGSMMEGSAGIETLKVAEIEVSDRVAPERGPEKARGRYSLKCWDTRDNMVQC